MNFNLNNVEEQAKQERRMNHPLPRLLNPEYLSSLSDEQQEKFMDRYGKLVMSFLHPDAGGDKESFQKFSETFRQITGSGETNLLPESAVDALEKEVGDLKSQITMFGHNTIKAIDRFEDIRHESPDVMSIFHKDGEVLSIGTIESDGTVEYELWKLDGYGGVKSVEEGYFENITQELDEDPDEFEKKNPYTNYQLLDGAWHQVVSLNTEGEGIEYLNSPAIKQSATKKSSIRIIGSADQILSTKNPRSDLLAITSSGDEKDFRFDITEVPLDELGKREINPEINTSSSGTLYYTKSGKLYTRSCYQLFISK